MRLYAEISKTEEVADGTIKVWGYASSGAEDSDGETITPAAMKAAIPDYMKFGAVREMHQAVAAGTAIEVSVEDDGRTFFGAHVVDPIAVAKVKNKVYKGFSIGGNVTARDKVKKTTITGIKLIEVSLVDRPANPDAVFTMYKAELEGKDAIDAIAQILDGEKVTPGMLLKAAQRLADPEPAKEVVKAGSMKKGMGALSNFACVLSSIAYMADDAAYEASWEKDGSPVPDQLKAWLTTGVQIFETMTTEETGELIAALKPVDGANAAIAAAATVTTTKVEGDAADEAAAAAVAAVAADPTTAAQDAAAAAAAAAETPAAKVETSAQPAALDLVKAELGKRDEQITKLTTALAEVTERLKKVEAQPAPGKAFLKAVSKGDDLQRELTPAEVETARLAASNDPLDLIKAAHRSGGQRVFGFPTS